MYFSAIFCMGSKLIMMHLWIVVWRNGSVIGCWKGHVVHGESPSGSWCTTHCERHSCKYYSLCRVIRGHTHRWWSDHKCDDGSEWTWPRGDCQSSSGSRQRASWVPHEFGTLCDLQSTAQWAPWDAIGIGVVRDIYACLSFVNVDCLVCSNNIERIELFGFSMSKWAFWRGSSPGGSNPFQQSMGRIPSALFGEPSMSIGRHIWFVWCLTCWCAKCREKVHCCQSHAIMAI